MKIGEVSASAGSMLSRPSRAMSVGVAWWQALLGVIALVNLGLWSVSAAAITHNPGLIDAETEAACRIQLLLSF